MQTAHTIFDFDIDIEARYIHCVISVQNIE